MQHIIRTLAVIAVFSETIFYFLYIYHGTNTDIGVGIIVMTMYAIFAGCIMARVYFRHAIVNNDSNGIDILHQLGIHGVIASQVVRKSLYKPAYQQVTTERLVEMMFGDKECGICFDPVDANNVYITPCAHVFCTGCADEWINSGFHTESCPSCRVDISTEWTDLESQN